MRKRLTAIRIGKRVIGKVHGDWFYKRLDAKRHFLKKPPAIAFDVQSLDDAETAGAKFVEVTDVPTQKQYKTSIANIRTRGFRFNRGHGEQIALRLNYWNEKEKTKEVQPTLF